MSSFDRETYSPRGSRPLELVCTFLHFFARDSRALANDWALVQAWVRQAFSQGLQSVGLLSTAFSDLLRS